MAIKVYLEIGKKVYENNGNWEITKIDKWRIKKKRFERLRDELTVKKEGEHDQSEFEEFLSVTPIRTEMSKDLGK